MLFEILQNQLTDPPESPRACELRNDTVLEVICLAGSDGGLSQKFLLEVISTNSLNFNNDGKAIISSIDSEVDNEISTMNDQVNI